MTVNEFEELEKRLQELAARSKGEEVIPESDIKIADMSPLQAYNAGRESICSQREAYQRGYRSGRLVQLEKDAMMCVEVNQNGGDSYDCAEAIREQDVS